MKIHQLEERMSDSDFYIRYFGEKVKDGVMGARESAEALLGFDEVYRYFYKQFDKRLSDEIELPVKVTRGAWKIDLLTTLMENPSYFVLAAMGAYGIATSQQAGKEGVFETGALKDVKKIAAKVEIALKWVVNIAKHKGTLEKHDLKTDIATTSDQNVVIKNAQGLEMKVPMEFFEIYKKCPTDLFSKLAAVIEPERELEIGSTSSEKAVITANEKSIFYKPKKDDESNIVLPELQHGDFVELEGFFNRLNEQQNSVGFQYKGHTITCKPEEGSINKFKHHMISQESDHILSAVKISGVVERLDKKGKHKDKRPIIKITDVKSIEEPSENNQPELF